MDTRDTKKQSVSEHLAGEDLAGEHPAGEHANEHAGGTAGQHLLEAIEVLRDDVAKVEFWANAVEQFAQPVPDYDPEKATVWVPPEMGSSLKRGGR